MVTRILYAGRTDMQMTCEWLECIRMIGEVYILTSTWDLGLGDREDRPNQSNIFRGWFRVDVYSPYRPLSDSLLKLASLVAFLCLFAL